MTVRDRILRLRIELETWQPAIWRRVEVSETVSLKALHDLIQAVMPFEDYHLFEFRADGKRYAIPDPEWDDLRGKTVSAKTAKLGLLVERGVTELAYTYDLGDDWRFIVTFETKADADMAIEYPRFLDGQGRAPPEDVGGLPGFETFLEAIADPDHEEHHAMKEWYGGIFDPNDIRRGEIARRVAKLARRRTLGKAAFAKSRNQIQ